MAGISPTMLKNGQRVLLEGEVYVVVESQQVAMGRGRGRVTVRLKHIVNGKVLERTYRSTDSVELADAEFRDMQFLYKENDAFVFMDTDSYDQFSVQADIVGEAADFLLDGTMVKTTFFQGEIIGIEIPLKMEFVIVETYDTVKGNTASNVTKDAKIETGYTVKVPLFIKNGERIRVNTLTGEYIERA
ncbi:MAG TPA: elongation factor P [Candidatus Sumerlaeota bacterium]|nr:elongation factor P [Candidatus Sumerlaeota bacterium]